MRTVEDHTFLIRDWTSARGCSAWRSLERLADDAHRIAAYADRTPLHRSCFGEMMGGPKEAADARKAERRYRLAAWVLRRIQEGRDEFDRLAKETEEKAEFDRIMAPPAPSHH